jgi:ABC-type glycerol-3-phosphate transport system substrate-binding protein
MKTKRSCQFWITIAFMLLPPGSWDPGHAWAKTEIYFWHAMGGHLNAAVDLLAKKFNEKQGEYEVKPLHKGTYPETMAAAIAAYRSKAPHTSCKSLMSAPKPCCSREQSCWSFN